MFEVSLEGSARKLVTVRSALQLVNQLPHPVEVRVDHAPSAGKTDRWNHVVPQLINYLKHTYLPTFSVMFRFILP